MRTFIGIELPGAWRSALLAGCQVIRSESPGWVDQKWVPAENLHLTLKFLGDLSSDAADTLPTDVTEALASLKAFQLTPKALFHPTPGRKEATMLWTTFDDAHGLCAMLAERIEDVAALYGVLPDTRAFSPHVTLCRTRRPRSFSLAEEASSAALEHLADLGVEPVLSVPAVTVFKSVLTRERPHYERLGTVKLVD